MKDNLNLLTLHTKCKAGDFPVVSDLRVMVGDVELGGVSRIAFGTPEKPSIESGDGFVEVTITCLARLGNE